MVSNQAFPEILAVLVLQNYHFIVCSILGPILEQSMFLALLLGALEIAPFFENHGHHLLHFPTIPISC